MHLKSLILKGFKSFADRSVLNYEPGITAIVGPNGSGKSNISDAVLWVLGERNAKNLRGQAMEDVVFAGSSARKPVGVAEVELVLDNSDDTLAVEFNEVAIMRRMYRSGESEYLINGTLARRMDVLDILHDTGLGTGTHSIISQGNLDSLLQSKPEDRRSLIEEAAGVLKHKQRKVKSERKLQQMDAHLTRVKDITAEVERQLKPLERKAKRAQAYLGLAEEMAGLNLALAVDDLRVLQEKWRRATEAEGGLEASLEEHRKKIASAEEQMQKLQEQMQQDSMTAGDLAARFRKVQSSTERLETTMLLLRERKRNIQSFEPEAELGIETNRTKAEAAKQGRAAAAGQLEEASKARGLAEEGVCELQAKEARLLEQRKQLDLALEQLGAQERFLVEEAEATRLAVAENQEVLSNSRAHEKLIQGYGVELEGRLERAAEECAQARAASEQGAQKLLVLAKDEGQAREKVAEAFAAREKARQDLDALRDELSLLIAEVKGLEERERAYESSTPLREWLLANKGGFDPEAEPLSHAVKAPPELEALVEGLLGNNLHGMVVGDLSIAGEVVKAAQRGGAAGEAVLIPKRGVARKPPSLPEGPSLLSFLEYPEGCQEALEALIGDVVLCDSAEEALDSYRKSQGRVRFATKDGFVTCAQGSIRIGLTRVDEQGALELHRRLEELYGKRSQLQADFDLAQGHNEEGDAKLKEAQNLSLRLSQELAQAQGVQQAAGEEAQRAEEKLASLKAESEALERQRQEAQEALAQAQPASEQLAVQAERIKNDLEGLRRQISAKQEERAPLRQLEKELADELSQARLSQATYAERETYARRMLETNSQEIENLEAEIARAQLALLTKRVAKRRIDPLLALFELLSDSAKAWTAGLEEENSKAQSSSTGIHAALAEVRKAARAAHDEYDATNERLSESRIEKGRLEVQVEAAIQTIVHDCKTPLETALKLERLDDRSEAEEAAFKLRRRIANMGTINPDAAVEYEELRERYDYMAEQLEDMLGARRALAKIVRVIDARMKDDFITTFEQVNINFQEIFQVLFPGGSAELALVDPEDPEYTGVEVTAQPRGKRITKMMLMSGGEKSLTALALLFAVYRIRSAPFYILDEVEAALDDSNLRRLCAYFDSLRQNTQLILITHQRRTMELADVLYGISMQADGVTRVVSQKLERRTKPVEG